MFSIVASRDSLFGYVFDSVYPALLVISNAQGYCCIVLVLR
jgi:hypothetical protein